MGYHKHRVPASDPKAGKGPRIGRRVGIYEKRNEWKLDMFEHRYGIKLKNYCGCRNFETTP